MKKLTSYAITARALQILLKSEEPLKCIPTGWFNWTGSKPDIPDAYSPQRLEIVSFENNSANIGRWCRNAQAARYACTLIAGMDEGHHVSDIPDLGSGVIYQLVTDLPSDTQVNKYFLSELREPEAEISRFLSKLRRSGGAFLDEVGFTSVTPDQWFAYGLELKDWIERTADGREDASSLRQVTPDFSVWNIWKDRLGPDASDTKLDLKRCWDTGDSVVWPWSVGMPCRVKDIPALESLGFEAFFPSRVMPCSGVARRISGELVPIGALPDEKDSNGNWVWDDGSIRTAFSPTTSTQWLDRIKLAFDAFVVKPYIAPRVRASSSGSPFHIELLDGDFLDLFWDEGKITLIPERPSGESTELWLIVLVADATGIYRKEFEFPFRVHERTYEFKMDKFELIFLIAKTNSGEII